MSNVKKVVSVNLGNYGSTGNIVSGISAVAKKRGLEYVPQALVRNEWNVVEPIFEVMNSGRKTTSFSTPKSIKRQKGLK